MFEPICIYTDVCVRFDEGAVSSQKRLQLHNIRASRPQACYTITSVGYGDITPKNVVERSVSSAARQGRSFAKKTCQCILDETGKPNACTCLSWNIHARGHVCMYMHDA